MDVFLERSVVQWSVRALRCSGHAYRYTIQPIFDNLTDRVTCHIRRRRPSSPVLFNLFYYVEVTSRAFRSPVAAFRQRCWSLDTKTPTLCLGLSLGLENKRFGPVLALSDSIEFIGAIEINLSINLSIYLSVRLSWGEKFGLSCDLEDKI